MTPARWLALAVLLVAAGFAFQGGEYSTVAWLDLRHQERVERARVAELRRTVDSLSRVANLVETDIDTQERIARERHGMLRKGEHAFILEEPAEAKP